MSYPPQQPGGYPQQGGYPPQQAPQGYPQQQPQGYPPQSAGYPNQAPPMQQPGYPPAAPARPPVKGTLDDFYGQPANAGKSIASWFQTPGQSLTGVVARDITNADIRPQTDMRTQQPKFYSDGRPMLTMSVPLTLVPPCPPEFADGRAAFIMSASDRDEMDRAMQEAGVPAVDGHMPPPEAGAVITVTFTGFKQIPGFGSPKKVKQITYQRPGGQAPQQQAQPAPAQMNGAPQGYTQQPQQQYAPQAQAGPQYAQPMPQNGYQQPAPQGYDPQAQQTPQNYAPQEQLPTQAGAPPYQGAPPQAMAQGPAPQQGPEPMDTDHQALLARLQGGQQPPQQ